MAVPKITPQAIIHNAKQYGHPVRARHNQRFFKTGPGQYGEGDTFLGLTVPEIRALAKQYRGTPLRTVEKLLHSPLHEIRLLSLIMLVEAFARSDPGNQKTIYEIYLKNLPKYVNNWDLVDTSAAPIVGAYLADKAKHKLVSLAKSSSIWERRVAMVATYYDIRRGKSDTALNIATLLVHDQHDLMQKAVGWMLREVGKRCSHADEVAFLEQHAHTMPRTMLRYALEHFSPVERSYFMKKSSSSAYGLHTTRLTS